MSISKYILEGNDQYRLQLRLRNIWLIRIRWFYIALFCVVVVSSANFAQNSMRLREFVIGLCAAGAIVNGLFWLILRTEKRSATYYRCVAAVQILLDVSMASAIIYFLGGLNSRAIILYAIPIISKGILFEGSFAYLAAVMSAIFYSGIVILYQTRHPMAYSLRETIQPLIFYSSVFLILAFLISRSTARTSLEQRDKTYSELLAMLRHQLHHPSSVIAALVEMLEFSDNYKQWNEKDKGFLKQLKRENLRLNNMISNLLQSVSERKEHPLVLPAKVDLLQLLNETAISCATGAKRIEDLKTNLPNQKTELDAIPDQLRTAFDNIVENAFHFSERGTPVTVSLERDEAAGYITITVTDQGIGMSVDEQKSLAKLFNRLEERTGGPGDESDKLYDMGLGLYVSDMIIRQHHGTMQIESKQNEGTRIIIKFKEALWLRPEFYT